MTLEGIIDPLITGSVLGDIIYLLIAVLAGWVIHFILYRILRKVKIRHGAIDVAHVINRLKAPARAMFILISLTFVYPLITYESERTDVVKHILTLFMIINVAWLSINTVIAAREVLLQNYDLTLKDNLKARKVYTQFKLIERILIFLIIIVAVGIGLMTFERIREIGLSLLASAGIAGIILGLAAQRIISTILAGIQLAITQPIRIDDVVIVEGEWGRIEEITLTYVVVHIWDMRRLVVPTTYFIEHPFQNWTRTSAEILGTVFIYTDYRVPIDELRQELSRLLEASEYWDGKVNGLQVTNAKEQTIELRALMSARNSSEAWNLRVYVREKLIGFLQENYPESLPKTRVEVLS